MKIHLSKRRKYIDDPKVIINKVNFDQVTWYRPYSPDDSRLIGVKGNLHFWNYDGFDPLKKDLSQSDIDNHEFKPSIPFDGSKFKV
jgi:hypothetical protein